MGIWYKEWYITTTQGESEMRAALADPIDGEKHRSDIQGRLTEMRQLDQDRCAISRDQIRFLEGVLSGAI